MNVLFIGNSHTYLHYMPQMLAELARAADIGFPLNIDQITGEGAGLQWHWNNSPSRDKIRNDRVDRVVLQDRSGGPLEELESFQIHARRLDEEIRRQGAKTVFYMTWANKSAPIPKDYSGCLWPNCHWLGADLAPVGLAWEKAQFWIWNSICITLTIVTQIPVGPTSRPACFMPFFSKPVRKDCRQHFRLRVK